VDANSDRKPDLVITGSEAGSEGPRRGDLFSFIEVFNVKVQERRSGVILALAHQIAQATEGSAGAAKAAAERLSAAPSAAGPPGQARPAASPPGEATPGGARPGEVRVVLAPGSGDDTIVAVVRELAGHRVVVTADRELRERCVAAGATTLRPGWLLGLLHP